MEGLFALLNQQLAIGEQVCRYLEIYIIYSFFRNLYAALLNSTPCLGAGRDYIDCSQEGQDIHAFTCKIRRREFCGGPLLSAGG